MRNVSQHDKMELLLEREEDFMMELQRVQPKFSELDSLIESQRVQPKFNDLDSLLEREEKFMLKLQNLKAV